jgi:threonylcarbamoyladenosine tRNA methylthiotransferase CDKAL1
MAKVWVEVYGCSASVSDGEIVKGLLVSDGHTLASNMDEADASIIVTCVVKDSTANRMVHRIKALSGKPLVVTGCMAKSESKRIERINSKASIVAPNALDKVTDALDASMSGLKYAALEDTGVAKVNLPRVRVNPIISIVQIANGCLSECTFCETRLAKGRLKSYSVEDIVRQISDDIKQGCKEVWLTSTDNGAYGLDIDTDIAKLLRAVCSIDADFMVRVGMMNPQYIHLMIDDLIEAYRDEKVFKFLHIPVQSGSDRVLRSMRRGYTVERFIDIVKRFRDELDCSIATDIIVGFPTESDDDFEATIEMIYEVEPDVINLSRYSARPDTPASSMEQLDKSTINERSSIMHEVVKDVCYRRSMLWRGWVGYVLVDEYADDGVQGRNHAYKPVYIHKPSIELGSKVKVRIDKVTTHSLIGSIIE